MQPLSAKKSRRDRWGVGGARVIYSIIQFSMRRFSDEKLTPIL